MGTTGHTLFVITRKVATELLSCDEWNDDRGLMCLLPELILDTTEGGSFTIVVINIEWLLQR